MRQIKFRAFDNLSPKMYTGHSVSIAADGSISFLDATGQWIEPEEGRIQVMQFTGLLDKNGKAIYEGDIMRRSTGHVFLMEPMWFSLGGAGHAKAYGYNYHENDEIIGNIHETPELLK